jgi:hypothetical protein
MEGALRQTRFSKLFSAMVIKHLETAHEKERKVADLCETSPTYHHFLRACPGLLLCRELVHFKVL